MFSCYKYVLNCLIIITAAYYFNKSKLPLNISTCSMPYYLSQKAYEFDDRTVLQSVTKIDFKQPQH